MRQVGCFGRLSPTIGASRSRYPHSETAIGGAALAVAWGVAIGGGVAAPVDVTPELRQAEERRVAVVERVSRSTIAIFEDSGTNGGSGVIVSPDGYAITNFHVAAPCAPRMTCGTNDGRTHDAVIVGYDPTGDIALVKLLGDGPFPTAEIGDSDAVRVGDEAIVVGNPFLLAEDFTPSVSIGVISGVHRYQPPSETLLEYADCLQTDAAINPGNSGGPLFDGRGRLIGINGRGSFEKRGRVSVGVGYAVSINQVVRFLPQLRSGRVVDHASLGATVRTFASRLGGTACLVDAVDRASDAYRGGLRPGDELVTIGGRDVRTANALLNRIGVLPAYWRTRIGFRRAAAGGVDVVYADIRLNASHRPGELRDAVAEQTPPAGPSDSDGERDEAWRAAYEPDAGFANRRFSRLETERVLEAWRRPGSGLPEGAAWALALRDDTAGVEATARIDDAGVAWQSRRGRFRFDADRDADAQATPPGAPGLLAALWVWRTLANGESESLDEVFYLGALPWEADGAVVDVVRVEHRGAVVDLAFDVAAGAAIGAEVSLEDGAERVRLGFEQHRTADADAIGQAPHRLRVDVGQQRYGAYAVEWRAADDGETPR